MVRVPEHDTDDVKKVVRVSIIEDDRITRESLATLVRRDPELELVGCYGNAEEAILDVPVHTPDIVIVDVNLNPPGAPGLDGADCVAALKQRCPHIQAIMLTVYDDHQRIFKSLRAGAAGYILKRARPAEIITAIKQLDAGGAPMSIEVARQVVTSFHGSGPQHESPALATLTRRERQILALLAKGGSAKEIAAVAGVSLGTVRVHLHAIYQKLGVDNRLQAVNVFLGR
jgi:DNA-binding NarL/FixJ family response regulator